MIVVVIRDVPSKSLVWQSDLQPSLLLIAHLAHGESSEALQAQRKHADDSAKQAQLSGPVVG